MTFLASGVSSEKEVPHVWPYALFIAVEHASEVIIIISDFFD